jgi:hypothetical protein
MTDDQRQKNRRSNFRCSQTEKKDFPQTGFGMLKLTSAF